MIKIISGYSHPAWSTLALVNLCNQFNSRGYDCIFYGPDNWHIDKCESGKLVDFIPESGDIIILNDIPLLSIGDMSNINTLVEESKGSRLLKIFRKITLKFLPVRKPHDYKLFLTCLSDDGLPCSSVRLSLFQKIHFASSALKSYPRTVYPKFVSPSFSNDIKMSEHKPGKTAGVIGSIKRQNNIREAVEKALLDGMETVIIFGYMKDPIYFYEKIAPLTTKYRGRIKYAGFVDDKQKMYGAVSDVYSSVSKPWSMVGQECAMTNTRYHAPESMGADERMANDQIFEIWKSELAL